MSNILNNLLADARKPEIPFGIHENCRITVIHLGHKSKSDGTLIKLNGFTTITQFNQKGKPIAEKEVAWFNIDSTSEHAYNNFVSQMEQMTGILLCYYSREELETQFNFLEAQEVETTEEFEEIFGDRKALGHLHEAMLTNYFNLLETKVGLDSELIRVKMVFDSKGRNLQAPRYGIFTEPNSITEEESMLKITDHERQAKVQSTASPKKKSVNTNI